MALTSSDPRVTRPSADATRERILTAALDLFADLSYEGATTREIAARAGVSQPSLNYHFQSKEALWQAAVAGLFAKLDTALAQRIDGLRGVDLLTTAKLVIRDFITFSAANPQLHRIITQESKGEGERIDWLVDHHIRPLYELTTTMFERLTELGAVPDIPAPFLYYLLTGAGPTIFVLAPECQRLAGFDPLSPEAVQTHADAVIRLLFGPEAAPIA
ncbi:TetR/AcrR family transcriptional regulator [Aquihabitans sp. McL0605]|uniref:TetR/AcrR family transcriptional regulator n=1 Tax=Aquihabitans sp. McL0605 TaxID=3415671 RepID=UPI003CEB5B50